MFFSPLFFTAFCCSKLIEPLVAGEAWFDFNDSRVHPIYDRALEKQFSGKESAYMLFYRKTTLVRPNKGRSKYLFGSCLYLKTVLRLSQVNLKRVIGISALAILLPFCCLLTHQPMWCLKSSSDFSPYIKIKKKTHLRRLS